MSVSMPSIGRLPSPGDRYSREDEEAARRVIDANFLAIARSFPALFGAAGSLGSGTADTTKFLRGDLSWSSILTGPLSIGSDLTLTTAGKGVLFTPGAGVYNRVVLGGASGITGGNSSDPAIYLDAQSGGTIFFRVDGGTVKRLIVQNNGTLDNRSDVTINSTTAVQLGIGTNGALVGIHDITNGGACLVLIDGSGFNIVSQLGATVFVTGAPTATQVQLAFAAGVFSAKGGSSRNGTRLTYSMVSFNW